MKTLKEQQLKIVMRDAPDTLFSAQRKEEGTEQE